MVDNRDVVDEVCRPSRLLNLRVGSGQDNRLPDLRFLFASCLYSSRMFSFDGSVLYPALSAPAGVILMRGKLRCFATLSVVLRSVSSSILSSRSLAIARL